MEAGCWCSARINDSTPHQTPTKVSTCTRELYAQKPSPGHSVNASGPMAPAHSGECRTPPALLHVWAAWLGTAGSLNPHHSDIFWSRMCWKKDYWGEQLEAKILQVLKMQFILPEGLRAIFRALS